MVYVWVMECVRMECVDVGDGVCVGGVCGCG